ncbi:MAG: DUF2274 domain-containing protein [Proteobacteria bacterium]|nr:DUF2274 domain-containing protein [Pseudomonadota bacterium]
MKLKNLPNKEPKVRHNFSTVKSESNKIAQYVLFASKNVSTALEEGEVIAAIVSQFIAEDRDFEKWLKNNAKENQEESKEV